MTTKHTHDELAEAIVGDASDLIRDVLIKHAKGIVGGTRELYDQLLSERRARKEAQHCAETMVVNLRQGVPTRAVLDWWDREGKAKARGQS